MGDDPLVELESRRFNRRQFLAASGLSLTAAALASACGPSTSPATGSASTAGASPVASASAGADPQKPVSLTFFHYATSNQEVVPKEITDQYMQENPHVTITLESGSNATTYPPLVAAYKTTGIPTINAGYFNAAASVQGDIDGLWQTLDEKRIPHLSDILEPYHRPGNKGVGWGLSVIGIPYRKDVLQAPPTSWLDLLDPQFKGRVGLVDAPLYFFNGLYAINHVLGGTESNMDPGFGAFSEAAKAGQFAQIFQAEQLIDLFLSGAFDMAGFSYGNVAPAIQKGSPLAFAIPTEGVIAFPLYFQITNGSTPEQVYHSEQILDRLLAPEALARYAELTLTVPASTKVQLPASLANDPAFAIDTVSNAIQVDWKASAENQATFLDRWNREVKANLA